jgi:hypothetical protein
MKSDYCGAEWRHTFALGGNIALEKRQLIATNNKMLYA